MSDEQIVCPSCGAVIYLDHDEIAGECPRCSLVVGWTHGYETGLDEAIKLSCESCAGKHDDTTVTEPVRVHTDQHVPNFGDVSVGEWLHATDWGGHRVCGAGKIREGTR